MKEEKCHDLITSEGCKVILLQVFFLLTLFLKYCQCFCIYGNKMSNTDLLNTGKQWGLDFFANLSVLQCSVQPMKCVWIQQEWYWALDILTATQTSRCARGPLLWRRVIISACSLSSSRPKRNLIYLRCLMVTIGCTTSDDIFLYMCSFALYPYNQYCLCIPYFVSIKNVK